MAEVLLDELVIDADQRRSDVFLDPASVPQIPVTAITLDSRTAVHGSLFCAIRGAIVDGHEHIDDAIDRGAVAVLAEEVRTSVVPTVLAADSRLAAALLAAGFAGHPSEAVELVGVTGTNGKTTIVTLLAHVVKSAGLKAVSLGTLTGTLTTPSATDFQDTLRRHVDDGAEVIAAEISSHALDQDRVAGSRVAVAIFSNLTQDHLDYHEDMESYLAAKAKLFHNNLAERAIVDVSTDYGRRIADLADIPVVEIDTAAIAEHARLEADAATFEWRGHTIRLPLGGRFNVANAVLVAECAVLLAIDVEDVVRALELAPPVPGRFEHVDAGQPFAVIIDYSHTPASLEAAVRSASELVDGKRVIVVFGAAGDRDQSKRPLMGRAARSADVVFVTSDNPRTEDPEAIIDDVLHELTHPDVRRVSNRRTAIHTAIGTAVAGDVVLIAGKGHEDYQIIGDTRHDFDDRLVAREALSTLGWESR